jgi:hypothetical protein
MLNANRGFNYGPDDKRVEPGTHLDDDFADAGTVDLLLSKGVLTPVIDDTVTARASSAASPSPNTRKPSKARSEAHSVEEKK